ncbi:vacuolar protein sorting-associated protein 18 homolog [Anopheles marshallii]|uniref:vacuolar protein sorting-associated protein 18 homolog n=1 Tax=Anopheles marshallii TaxID=1521116 RepID=UPI00237C24BF|nr:vacuolar protein sorting-associated protein 18 homolog [Anopheles marshallii]
MASMFDQYSSDLIRESSTDVNMCVGPKTSGYVSVRTRKEVPIFTKQKMNLNLPSGILYLSVQNDWLMMLMTNLTVLRMNLKQPGKFTEVPIDKTIGGLRPSSIYLDPLGTHLFLTFLPKSSGFTPELLYLQRNSFKPKFITKLKDHEITAIGFNHVNTSETSTGPILLGTAHGVIWEAEVGFESGDKLIQNNVRVAFDVGKGEPRPITGLEFYLKTEQKHLHCIVLVLTVDRLYKFHNTIRSSGNGTMASSTMTAAQELKLGGYLQKVFSPYQNVDDQLRDFEELSAGGGKGPTTGSWPKLVFNYEEDFPKSFGCLTEHGINYQEIDPAINQPQFVVQKELITYPEPRFVPPATNSHKVTPRGNCPLSFILTDFHALLLYADHVSAISLLDYQVVYEEYFVEQYGRLINIVKDVRSNVTFVYSNKLIFRYKIVNEQRNAWRLYADRQKFDLALQYCNKNPAHRDIVLVKQAQSYFYASDYLQAAAIFSETQLSFEEVCLKFLQKNCNQALLLYLRNRLGQLKPHEMTQITMLIVWIVQLFLVELSHQRVGGEKATRDLQKQFEAFMASRPVMACVRRNRTAIYDLMASYGDTHNLTALTTINQDYESVIQQYINQGRYEDALAVLSAQNRPELVYQYAPIAMEMLPTATVGMLIGQGHRLDPVRLMPALLCLDTVQHAHETVRYLEYCIHSRGCAESALHNYLIQLYGVHFPDQLLTFLESQGRDTTMVHYDPHYALRIALRHDIRPASVFLHCLLEMWVPAVRLALTLDDPEAARQLARQTAAQPTYRALRKRLWLLIAEHEIRGTRDEEVQRALGILQECDQLRIEDLLPYFSDFQRIDHFKEAICRSLKEYNVKIQEQRRDMEESAKSANRVRQELQTFRGRSVTISAQEQCAVCSVYLLLKPFFVFHCGHKFHADCLERQVVPYLSTATAERLTMLKQNLAATQHLAEGGTAAAAGGTSTTQDAATVQNGSHKEKLKGEIEAIISSECLYCGHLMINALDKPFIENWQQADSEWE